MNTQPYNKFHLHLSGRRISITVKRIALRMDHTGNRELPLMKRIARVLGITLGLLAVIVVSLPFLINANQFRPMLESKLSQGLGREVKLGDLKFSVLSGGVTASDLSIADHPAYSKAPFLRAKSLTVSAELWPFIFSRKLHVTGIAIDQPEI